MADDLDDFLSELGISKTDGAAPALASSTNATTDANPDDFLDWLNEPTSSATVTQLTPSEAVDASFLSAPPTPPKVEALPLPSLEAIDEQPPVVAFAEDLGVAEPSSTGAVKVSDDMDFGFASEQPQAVPSASYEAHHLTEGSIHSRAVEDFGFNSHEDVAAQQSDERLESQDFSETPQHAIDFGTPMPNGQGLDEPREDDFGFESQPVAQSAASAQPETEDFDFGVKSTEQSTSPGENDFGYNPRETEQDKPSSEEGFDFDSGMQEQKQSREEDLGQGVLDALGFETSGPQVVEDVPSAAVYQEFATESQQASEDFEFGSATQPQVSHEPQPVDEFQFEPSQEQSINALDSNKPVEEFQTEGQDYEQAPDSRNFVEDLQESSEPVNAEVKPIDESFGFEVTATVQTTNDDNFNAQATEDFAFEAAPVQTTNDDNFNAQTTEEFAFKAEPVQTANDDDLNAQTTEDFAFEAAPVQTANDDDLNVQATEDFAFEAAPVQTANDDDVNAQASEDFTFEAATKEDKYVPSSLEAEFVPSVSNDDFIPANEEFASSADNFENAPQAPATFEEEAETKDFAYGTSQAVEEFQQFEGDTSESHAADLGFGGGSQEEYRPRTSSKTVTFADESASGVDKQQYPFGGEKRALEPLDVSDAKRSPPAILEKSSTSAFSPVAPSPRASALAAQTSTFATNNAEADIGGDDDDFVFEVRTPMKEFAGETVGNDDSFIAGPPTGLPKLDLSFNDFSSPTHTPGTLERHASRGSLGSVPQTPSGSNLVMAPLSSVRPIPPAERLALWSAALKAFEKPRRSSSVGSAPMSLDASGGGDDDGDGDDDDDSSRQEVEDESVSPMALEVLESISSSKAQGAKLVFALRRVWGAALSVKSIGFAHPKDFVVSERTGSLMRALVAYHDPELAMHLDQITSFTWSRCPYLFGFYAGKENACLELWDLGIVKVHPGFESPQSGSMFFAFGVCASRRSQLMQCMTLDEVMVALEEASIAMRQSHDEAARWAIFSSRIARETPRTFRSLLGQCEMDLAALGDAGAVYTDGTNEDYEEPTEPTFAATSAELSQEPLFEIDPVEVIPHPEEDRRSVQSQESGKNVGQLLDTLSSSAKPSAPSSSLATWSKWKEIATKTAKQLSDKLAGPIDAEDNTGRTKNEASMVKQRRIRLVVLDQNHLGCKLSLSKSGLMCVGYGDGSDQIRRKGVKEGDIIHAINGATILVLPPASAEQVARYQERPLYVTIATASTVPFEAKQLNRDRLGESKRMLLKPLSEFYGRHGPSKVDRCEEILELYAGKERQLLNGLYEKYGEMVPGDEQLRCESGAAIVTADEIVDFLEHPDDKDHLLVDIRDITERADTGYFAASVLYGYSDVMDRLKEAKRTYLIGSGRSRELAIADPIKAKAEARLDLERTKIIIDKLWREGVKRVAVVLGGYAQVAKELKQRGVEVLITSQGSGSDFKLLDWYLKLDLENPQSAAQYLANHLGAPRNKGRRSSSVTSDHEHQSTAATATTSVAQPMSIGSVPSRRSTSNQDASSQLATEDDDEDSLPAPPTEAAAVVPSVAAAHAAKETSAAAAQAAKEMSAATAKAASAAAAMASSTWSKWVTPSLTKSKPAPQ